MPTGYLEPDPPCISPKAPVVVKAASATLTPAEFNGRIITNTGSITGITLTLPDPSLCAGCVMKVQVTGGFSMTLDPGTKKIYVGGDGVAGKNAIIQGPTGTYLNIYSDGVDFLIFEYTGVVTKAP